MQMTMEQTKAVQLALTGQDLKIEALAGTGKTTTLIEIAKQLETKRGLYLAFNKSIATDARTRLPRNVDARTLHSLALQQLKNTGSDFQSRLVNRIPLKTLAHFLPSEQYQSQFARKLIQLANQAITRFSHSSSSSISDEYISEDLLERLAVLIQTKLQEDSNATQNPTDNPPQPQLEAIKRHLRSIVLRTVESYWKACTAHQSNVPVTHDIYLKVWVLTKPVLDVAFILYDEAQDANPVTLQLLALQQAQVIYVGDPHQQIYAWRGSVNAMREIVTPHTCQLTQSFRFGAAIADIANILLEKPLKSPHRIIGFEEVDSFVGATRPDAVLFRTNSGMLEVLLNLLSRNKRVYLEVDTSHFSGRIQALLDIQKGKTSRHPDFLYCESWSDVTDAAEEDDDLARLIKVGTQFGFETLLEMLKQTVATEEQAEITLVTVHKSKGREWDHVALAKDFRLLDSSSTFDPQKSIEEGNILYVAATRARIGLDIRDCEALSTLVMANGQEAVNNTHSSLYSAATSDAKTATATAKPYRRGETAQTGSRTWASLKT